MNDVETQSPDSGTHDLSFVLCSRNDHHGGNSLWRLETTLNFLAHSAENTIGLASVEVLVCDWGSTHPLREAVALTPEASKITRFLEVPPELAEKCQADSLFAEVYANNVAIRRASGQFIGRIDQDTLVGEAFFLRLHRLLTENTELSLKNAVMFIGRSSIPLSFSSRSPCQEQVRAFVDSYGGVLPREGIAQDPWFDAPVGIILMHRYLWEVSRGYDQSLRYWGFMETDLVLRLQPHYPLINLEKEIGRDFFHLAHGKRSLKSSPRVKNERVHPKQLAPNSSDWGLSRLNIELRSAEASVTTEKGDYQQIRVSFIDLFAEWSWQQFCGVLRRIRALLIGNRVSEVNSK